MINFGLYATYVLIAICVLAILFFAISRIISQPAGAKSALAGIGALVVIALLGYLLSTGTDAEQMGVSEGISHTSGTGLMTLYIIMALTVLSILYVELSRLFK